MMEFGVLLLANYAQILKKVAPSTENVSWRSSLRYIFFFYRNANWVKGVLQWYSNFYSIFVFKGICFVDRWISPSSMLHSGPWNLNGYSFSIRYFHFSYSNLSSFFFKQNWRTSFQIVFFIAEYNIWESKCLT